MEEGRAMALKTKVLRTQSHNLLWLKGLSEIKAKARRLPC